MKKNTGSLNAAKAAGLPAVLLACGLLASALLSLAGCAGLIPSGSFMKTTEGSTVGRAAIRLSEDTWTDGAISATDLAMAKTTGIVTGGEQWFTFTASAGTQYLHVFFGTLTELYVQLYDGNGNALGAPTGLGGSTTHTALTVTRRQTYFIKVTPNPYGPTSGTYRIGFNTVPLAPGILSAAAPLSPDTWTDGVLTPANGEQWFTFTASAGTQYLHVLFGTLTDLDVQLYDGNGNALGAPTGLGGSTTYTALTVTNGQLYYVRVTPSPYRSNSGTYRIGFNTMPLAPGILSAAAPLSPDTWTDGVLTPANGEQWFMFTANTGTQYLHVMFGTLGYLDVQLYDGNGNVLGDALQLQGRTTSTSLMVTSGQVYYVKVTPSPYRSNSGTYRITFNNSDAAPATN
jgi:hypothetical protein